MPEMIEIAHSYTQPEGGGPPTGYFIMPLADWRQMQTRKLEAGHTVQVVAQWWEPAD